MANVGNIYNRSMDASWVICFFLMTFLRSLQGAASGGLFGGGVCVLARLFS